MKNYFTWQQKYHRKIIAENLRSYHYHNSFVHVSVVFSWKIYIDKGKHEQGQGTTHF